MPGIPALALQTVPREIPISRAIPVGDRPSAILALIASMSIFGGRPRQALLRLAALIPSACRWRRRLDSNTGKDPKHVKEGLAGSGRGIHGRSGAAMLAPLSRSFATMAWRSFSERAGRSMRVTANVSPGWKKSRMIPSSGRFPRLVPLPVPVRAAPGIEMPQDRDPMATRVDMTKAKPPGIRNGHVQLLARTLQAFPARIVVTGRESPMASEEPEQEDNPDPAVEIEALDEPRVVEIQAPAFQKGPIGHAHLSQAGMPDHGSAAGQRQRLVCARSVP